MSKLVAFIIQLVYFEIKYQKKEVKKKISKKTYQSKKNFIFSLYMLIHSWNNSALFQEILWGCLREQSPCLLAYGFVAGGDNTEHTKGTMILFMLSPKPVFVLPWILITFFNQVLSFIDLTETNCNYLEVCSV